MKQAVPVKQETPDAATLDQEMESQIQAMTPEQIVKFQQYVQQTNAQQSTNPDNGDGQNISIDLEKQDGSSEKKN